MTQLRNESVTTRSRPFANKFNYARDMCHGTSVHPASVKAPGKSQKADGLTKVLAGASMKTFVSDLGLAPLTLPEKQRVPIRLCETTPIDVALAEYYVEELWAALDQTLLRSKCGAGSDKPVGQGGTLDMKTFKIVGAPAPIREVNPDPTVPSYPAPGIPEPPDYLPEMKDAVIVKHTIQALSPRIIAVHGPTRTGKSTVFRIAITHWAEHAEGLKQGLTVCAWPRRILAQQLE